MSDKWDSKDGQTGYSERLGFLTRLRDLMADFPGVEIGCDPVEKDRDDELRIFAKRGCSACGASNREKWAQIRIVNAENLNELVGKGEKND